MTNKTILKVLHFFGLYKDSEHIDDVKINITINQYSEAEQYIILDNKETESMIQYFKSSILERFKKDPKLEQRCRNVSQVWITFYDNPNDKTGIEKEIIRPYSSKRIAGVSVRDFPWCLKMFYYVDGTLYHPQLDSQSYERDQLLKKILE